MLDYFPENLDGSDKVLENLEKIKKRLEKDELPDELQELIDNYLRTFENVYVTDNLVDFESYCANFTPLRCTVSVSAQACAHHFLNLAARA